MRWWTNNFYSSDRNSWKKKSRKTKAEQAKEKVETPEVPGVNQEEGKEEQWEEPCWFCSAFVEAEESKEEGKQGGHPTHQCQDIYVEVLKKGQRKKPATIEEIQNEITRLEELMRQEAEHKRNQREESGEESDSDEDFKELDTTREPDKKRTGRYGDNLSHLASCCIVNMGMEDDTTGKLGGRSTWLDAVNRKISGKGIRGKRKDRTQDQIKEENKQREKKQEEGIMHKVGMIATLYRLHNSARHGRAAFDELAKAIGIFKKEKKATNWQVDRKNRALVFATTRLRAQAQGRDRDMDAGNVDQQEQANDIPGNQDRSEHQNSWSEQHTDQGQDMIKANKKSRTEPTVAESTSKWKMKIEEVLEKGLMSKKEMQDIYLKEGWADLSVEILVRLAYHDVGNSQGMDLNDHNSHDEEKKRHNPGGSDSPGKRSRQQESKAFTDTSWMSQTKEEADEIQTRRLAIISAGKRHHLKTSQGKQGLGEPQECGDEARVGENSKRKKEESRNLHESFSKRH